MEAIILIIIIALTILFEVLKKNGEKNEVLRRAEELDRSQRPWEYDPKLSKLKEIIDNYEKSIPTEVDFFKSIITKLHFGGETYINEHCKEYFFRKEDEGRYFRPSQPTMGFDYTILSRNRTVDGFIGGLYQYQARRLRDLYDSINAYLPNNPKGFIKLCHKTYFRESPEQENYRNEMRLAKIEREKEMERQKAVEAENLRKKTLANKYTYFSVNGYKAAYFWNYYPLSRYPSGTIPSRDEQGRKAIWNFKRGVSQVGVNKVVDFIDGNFRVICKVPCVV